MPAPVPASPLQACQKALKTVAIKCCGLFCVWRGKCGTKVPTARLNHASPQAVCRDTRLVQLSPRYSPGPTLIITPTHTSGRFVCNPPSRGWSLPRTRSGATLSSGCSDAAPQNHARRVPQPCLHGYGRAAGVSVTPGLIPHTRP